MMIVEGFEYGTWTDSEWDVNGLGSSGGINQIGVGRLGGNCYRSIDGTFGATIGWHPTRPATARTLLGFALSRNYSQPSGDVFQLFSGATSVAKVSINTNQIKHPIGEHLAVDAQIAPVRQRLQHGVRNRADAYLQGCAIFHQFSHIPTNLRLHCIGHSALHLIEWSIPSHGIVDLGEMYKAIAVCARHLGIDQRHDLSGMINCRTGDIHR